MQYSGAIYTIVPITVCVKAVVEPAAIGRVTPKSVSLARQLDSNRTFALHEHIQEVEQYVTYA